MLRTELNELKGKNIAQAQHILNLQKEAARIKRMHSEVDAKLKELVEKMKVKEQSMTGEALEESQRATKRAEAMLALNGCDL